MFICSTSLGAGLASRSPCPVIPAAPAELPARARALLLLSALVVVFKALEMQCMQLIILIRA